jgi:hypothetical protein
MANGMQLPTAMTLEQIVALGRWTALQGVNERRPDKTRVIPNRPAAARTQFVLKKLEI